MTITDSDDDMGSTLRDLFNLGLALEDDGAEQDQVGPFHSCTFIYFLEKG